MTEPGGRELPGPDSAPERTNLAWGRSWIAFAAIGVALLRRVPSIDGPRPEVAWALLGAAGALALAGGAYGRHRRRTGLASRRALFVVALGTVLTGVASFGLALASRP